LLEFSCASDCAPISASCAFSVNLFMFSAIKNNSYNPTLNPNAGMNPVWGLIPMSQVFFAIKVYLRARYRIVREQSSQANRVRTRTERAGGGKRRPRSGLTPLQALPLRRAGGGKERRFRRCPYRGQARRRCPYEIARFSPCCHLRREVQR